MNWTEEELAEDAFKEVSPEDSFIIITRQALGNYHLYAQCEDLCIKGRTSLLSHVIPISNKVLIEAARDFGIRLSRALEEKNEKAGLGRIREENS